VAIKSTIILSDMETESNVKPSLIERYDDFVRINYDVKEETRGNGGEAIVIYKYRMLEMDKLPTDVDELANILYCGCHPVAEQVHIIASGVQNKIFKLDKCRRTCIRTAKKILDIPYTLDELKDDKIAEITAYDASDAVNSFVYNGVSMWLDKETRVGLSLRFRSEQAAGATQTTLWSGTQSFTLNIDDGLKLLAAVEVYASAAYDVTAKHKANVLALTDAQAVEEYDYKTGYPKKLSL